MKSDLDALKRFNMSAADMDKLNAWEALINDTGTMVMNAAGQCTSAEATMLGATQANVTAAGTGAAGRRHLHLGRRPVSTARTCIR